MPKLNFCLGTAQFGSKYGISNTSKKVNYSEIEKILEFSETMNINKIDTAFNYGNAEQTLGKIGVSKWNIQSKILIKYKDEKLLYDNIKRNINKSLDRLKVNKIDNLLLHNEEQLIQSKKENIYDILINLKKDGYISNYGVSYYDPKKLSKTLKNFKIDVIQVPINIFDHRFINLLGSIRNRVKNIQVRSIFLQGLLLMNKIERKIKFNKWESNFKKFESWNTINNLNALQSCINFVKNVKNIDDIVIGVQSKKELVEIISAFNSLNKLTTDTLKVNDIELINPVKW